VSAAIAIAATALVVLLLATSGARAGGRRVAGRTALFVVLVAIMVATSALGFARGWFQPLGLITPPVFGTVIAGVAGLVISVVRRGRDRRRGSTGCPTAVDRAGGAFLGALLGVVVAASLWMLASLTEAVVHSRADDDAAARREPAPRRGLAHELVRTANRGFVRHLPGIGDLGDEVEAMVKILDAPADLRARLARAKRWEHLAALPSFQALVDDGKVFDEIAAFDDGDWLALYRLQRHPRVLAFLGEPEVHELVLTTRISSLARELEECDGIAAPAEPAEPAAR